MGNNAKSKSCGSIRRIEKAIADPNLKYEDSVKLGEKTLQWVRELLVTWPPEKEAEKAEVLAVAEGFVKILRENKY
jgi:hypothetical protein